METKYESVAYQVVYDNDRQIINSLSPTVFCFISRPQVLMSLLALSFERPLAGYNYQVPDNPLVLPKRRTTTQCQFLPNFYSGFGVSIMNYLKYFWKKKTFLMIYSNIGYRVSSRGIQNQLDIEIQQNLHCVTQLQQALQQHQSRRKREGLITIPCQKIHSFCQQKILLLRLLRTKNKPKRLFLHSLRRLSLLVRV